jgi:soluble lytic murein transglycosylase
MARKPLVRKEIRKEKTLLFWLAALALTLLLPSQTLADIYKYVDEEGVIHFTNVPTDGKFKLFYREKPVHFQSEH